MQHGVLVGVARAGRFGQGEAGGRQTCDKAVPQAAEGLAPLVVAHGLGGRDDFEINILRHAPDQAVGAGQAGPAGEDQAKRCRVDGEDGPHGLHDVPVLFHRLQKPESEVILGGAQFEFDGLIQHASPFHDEGDFAIEELPRESPVLDAHRGVDWDLR